MKPKSKRGSLLLVTLLFATIIAMFLVSYLQVATTAVKLSNRASWENQALNLTEMGLEQGMSAINTSTFTGWTTSGNAAFTTFPGNSTTYNLGQGVTGTVKVYVQNYNVVTSTGNSTTTLQPSMVAEGIVKPPQGDTIVKWVEISGLIQRPLFGHGLVGRNGVSFSGNNASVDSWNSHYDDTGTARSTPVAYSSSVKHDKGSIAAINISATDTVQNADIWGTASVGGSSSSLVSVGPQGLVGPFGTSSGTKVASAISTNFTAQLPTVSAPTPPSGYTLSAINNSTSLPRAGDTAASDGKYYYTVPSVSLSGNGAALSIASGNVVLILTAGQGTTAISISGKGELDVASGSHLDIYTAGDISIAGNGIVNSNDTSASNSLQIWGTNTSSSPPGQNISVSGNGSLAATVYAPNAAISAKGGGNSGAIYGAFVGYSVTMTGNDAFHYDESLATGNYQTTYMPSHWRELVTVADRATYSSQFSGW